MGDKYTPNEKPADVIPLGRKREKSTDNVEPSQPAPDTDFAAVMAKNAANKKRQEEDRAKANKGVTRSYRLKH